MKLKILLSCIGLLTSISVLGYSGGTGTEQDPYRIASRVDMEELANTVNEGTNYFGVCFLLTQDLTEITSIIGSGSYPFNGIFDGGGHTLKVNIRTENRWAGVFGYADNATIKNLGVNGSVTIETSEDAFAGGICGYTDAATISNCHNSAKVSAACAGGICGSTYYNNTVINNCYNTGNIISSSGSGGICGSASMATIDKCYNTGEISAVDVAGGICAGSGSSSRISNCYNTGNITSSSCVGGICGVNNGIISDCHNAGEISATTPVTTPTTSYSYFYAGGICGSGGTINNSNNTAKISATTTSSDYYSYSGGICGKSGFISSCYNTGEIFASYCAGGISGGEGRVSNCYNTGKISADVMAGGISGGSSTSNCYNTGEIFASDYAGGICGAIGWLSTIRNCFAANASITATGNGNDWIGRIATGSRTSIENCYALSNMLINGVVTGHRDNQDGLDATIAQFQSQNWLIENLAWDFTDVWYISESRQFPKLRSQYSNPSCPDGTFGAGDALTWEVCNGTLTIGGTGVMPDFGASGNTAPWYSYREDIATVVVGSGVANIGAHAFYGCNRFSFIMIPASVTSIGEMAFGNCGSLTEIAVASNNPSYSSEGGVLFTKNKTRIIQYPAGKANDKYVIPESVTSIDYAVFWGCSSLKSVVLPANVNSIGGAAFAYCNSLTDVAVNWISTPPAIDSNVFSGLTLRNITLHVPPGTGIIYMSADVWQEFNIVEQSDVLCPWGRFGEGNTLMWEFCNDTLTISGTGAMPDYNTSDNTSPWYSYREDITAIVVESGVTAIGAYAFSSCTNLISVTNLNPEPQEIRRDVFDGVPVEDIPLYVPAESVELYMAAPVWKDFGTITACMTSAINAPVAANAIRVYPDPATESFRIEGVNGTAQVTVTDASGRIVFRKTLAGNEPIAADGWQQGVYLVSVNGKTVKVIKSF